MFPKKKVNKSKFGAMRYKARHPYRASPVHFFYTKDEKLLCGKKPPAFSKQRWQTLPTKSKISYNACCRECYWNPDVPVSMLKTYVDGFDGF